MTAQYVFEKSAAFDGESRRACDAIMGRIYEENPSYFPYGLRRDMLDGGCWMVRQASTNTPVGFVGWQERPQGFRKIDYYAVGILPEYRGCGMAKQAVYQLIKEKSASVDEVRAFIVPGNEPSMALAASLGVPVVHPVTARAWEIQKRLRVRKPVKGYGRLLETLP